MSSWLSFLFSLSWLSFLFNTASRIPQLWYGDEPAYIEVRDEDDEEAKGRRKMSVRAFVESRVESLTREYWPTWWLRSGHLQTVYCVVGDFTKIHLVSYTRKQIELPDGGILSLDFLASPSTPLDAPLIVVCHGLAGGSSESYVRDILEPACRAKEAGGLGYRGVVMNARGCADTRLMTPQLYSAGNTEDLRTTLLYLSIRFPDAPMIGLGFSLGACVMTRYLAEEGDQSRLKAACVLGCPWNLVQNSHRLENNWFIRNTYSKAMGKNLVRLLKVHLPIILSSPLTPEMAVDVDKLLSIRFPTLNTVDQHMVRHLGGPAPHFPFETSTDYHRWASCHTSLPSIRVPLICFNSTDDPVITHKSLPYEYLRNAPWVVLALSNGGGHLGWFEGGGSPPRRWVQTPVLEYLRAVAEDYIPPTNRSSPGWEKQDGGFIIQEGRPDIGFKELPGDEKIEGADGEDAVGLMAGI